MKKVFTCPVCGASGTDNFEYYVESVITEYRAITKQGKVSTRILRRSPADDGTMPSGLLCLNCDTGLNYETDENGIIIDIWQK